MPMLNENFRNILDIVLNIVVTWDLPTHELLRLRVSELFKISAKVYTRLTVC